MDKTNFSGCSPKHTAPNPSLCRGAGLGIHTAQEVRGFEPTLCPEMTTTHAGSVHRHATPTPTIPQQALPTRPCAATSQLSLSFFFAPSVRISQNPGRRDCGVQSAEQSACKPLASLLQSHQEGLYRHAFSSGTLQQASQDGSHPSSTTANARKPKRGTQGSLRPRWREKEHRLGPLKGVAITASLRTSSAVRMLLGTAAGIDPLYNSLYNHGF